jgi:hypothetical protein
MAAMIRHWRIVVQSEIVPDLVGLTMPNQPRADKRHAARRLHLDVRPPFGKRSF